MARGSRSPDSSSRSHNSARDRPPHTDFGRIASDSRGSRRERDSDYNSDREKSSRYDDSRERSRREDKRRGDRRDDGGRFRSRRGSRERDTRDDRGYRDSERGYERTSRREPEWGTRAQESSRRSASPRGRSRANSRSKSRSKSPEDKAKPNFGASGLLAAETKTVRTGDGTKTVLKYHEPPEARKPLVGWRLYVFKDDNQSDVLHIHRQSAYLFGRDRAVVDAVLEHPSCSKQHAVIQYRQIQEKNEYGEVNRVIKPFIIDLESTNGTHVNGETIPTSRYYELRLSDVIKFGESSREYVLLSEDAA